MMQEIPEDHFHVGFKQRQIVFTLRDEALFSELLKLEFPNIRFFDWENSSANGWRKGELSNLVEGGRDRLTLVFPEYMGPIQIEERFARDQTWLKENREPEHRSMTYLRGGWDWSRAYYQERLLYDSPTLTAGEISARYYPDDPFHTMQLAIVRRVWKAMSRVAVGKFKGGHPIGNALMMGTDVVLMKDIGRRNPWMGHWALQWCRDGIAAKERRMLCGSYRPCDDWEMPKTPTYESLCRVVDEKYGKEFGKAPTEPEI